MKPLVVVCIVLAIGSILTILISGEIKENKKAEMLLNGHDILTTGRGDFHIPEKCERCRELQLARDQEMIQMIIEGLEQ